MGIFSWLRKREKVRPRRRSYSGAAVDRLVASWIGSTGSADAAVQHQLARLRARSRQLAEDNEYIRRYLALLKTNVIGPDGFTYQSRVVDEWPDGSVRPDERANRLIERAFSAWSESTLCSAIRAYTLHSMQCVAIAAVARDGEVLVLRVKEKPRDNPHGMSVRLLEADYLDETYDARLQNGNTISMGIETNPNGVRVAYHLFTSHPGDRAANASANTRTRIPASDLLHIGICDRPGQNRYAPWLHAAMRRVNMCAGYEEAELVAARAGASKMGMYVSPGDVTEIATEDAGEFIESVSPGQFAVAPPGYDFKMIDPTHPTDAFGEFLGWNLRAICSGLNVAYTSISMDLRNATYGSMRQGILDERDHWMLLQKWWIDSFLRPIYAWWLESALMAGTVPLPIAKYDKFNRPQFRGRRWTWIDPAKDAAAATSSLTSGIKSMHQVIADMGGDFDDVELQLREEIERLSKVGVVHPVLRGQPQMESSDDDKS